MAAEPYPSSGYPLAIHLISLPGRSLAAIATMQHLAGLVTGLLVYGLLVRLGTSRWAAVLAAALVLLDANRIVLEQLVLTETLFALALTGAAFLTVMRGRGPTALALAGALIAYAVTVRAAGLFAVPVWLVYLIWTRTSVRGLVAAVALLALPLVGYAFWYQRQTGTFGFDQADGWFLYGRVAAFADCRHDPIPAATRALCNFSRLPADRRDPSSFIWDPDAPARLAFNMFDPNVSRRKHDNAMLRAFAFAVIRDHPFTYATTVAKEFSWFFLDFPSYGRFMALGGLASTELAWIQSMRHKLFPGSKEPTHTPAALSVYEYGVRTPFEVFGILSFLALLGGPLVSLRRRVHVRLVHRKECFLLTGMALAVLLGSVAVSMYQARFLVMTAPLIVCGGFLALHDLRDLANREVPIRRE